MDPEGNALGENLSVLSVEVTEVEANNLLVEDPVDLLIELASLGSSVRLQCTACHIEIIFKFHTNVSNMVNSSLT